MNANKVQSYVDTQVQMLGDRRIKPIMDAIAGELALKRENDAAKAELDKENAESDKRIEALQLELGKANTEVNDLAVKLAEAVAAAPNTGATSGNE